MFRKKKKEAKIELYELWSLDHTLARIISRYLKAVFRVYQMDYPDYEFHDTLAASRRHFGCRLPNHQLQTVAAACGYDLVNHHHALADAEACAVIAMQLL